ncbi:phosphate uptake regulator PhoU [Salinirubellus salinus]|jgi:phosphate uptake regulator|uniref:Phosphate uptake regulator PhoU n=1 Tax=Salinirubellus salinus TaxID=1364945 RepID=A0A9E7R6L8_9EURY|nr:AbrB/MazE/SpoVT family DNA-binding domain-containing protein [Salinirubellus salinus]UWM56789.1 phosphate uptake regulator PhoU [Salinirubellus salinus]
METRKLQCVGGGTYTVSIPKGWATEHRLESGTEVHLYTHRDGSIVLRSSHHDGESLSEVTVELTGMSTVLAERAVRAAYAAGFETVRLSHAETFTDDQRRRVDHVAHHLTGTAVEGEGPDEVVLRSLLDASDVSVRQTVVQVRFTALSMYRRATEALLEAERGVADRLDDRRKEAERLAALLDRQANRSLVALSTVDELGTSRPALADHDEAASLLAAAADDAVTVATAAEGLETPLPEEVAEAFGTAVDETRRSIEVATEALLEGASIADAAEALDHSEAAAARVAAVDEALREETLGVGERAQVVSLTRALDAVDRTAGRAAGLAEVALRAATREADS